MNREPVGSMVVGSCVGYSNQKVIEFLFFCDIRWEVSKTTTLDFWRSDFRLFRILVGSVPWEIVVKGRGVQDIA